MSGIQLLAAQALVGTRRAPLVVPSIPGDVGALLEQVAAQSEATDDTRLLRVAGVLAVCGAAGYQPPAMAADSQPRAPAELSRTLDDRQLADAFSQILNDGPPRLQYEALRRLAAAGACLPPALLPKALEQGRQNTMLRPAVVSAIGSRGRWLAQQNPDWSYAETAAAPDSATLDPEPWQNGSHEQRLAWFGQCRQVDPATARSLLVADWSNQAARERAALLNLLLVGLGPADEDFLESALRDRSKEVRAIAGQLLAALPGSRYAARMGARLAASLNRAADDGAAWRLDAPAEWQPAWKDDALEEAKPNGEPLGQRAWWLYQWVRAVPLAWWTTHLGLTAAELLAWAESTDWTQALWRGWFEALRRAPEAEWAEAWLARPPQKGFVFNAAELVPALPPAARERHWLAQLQRPRAERAAGDVLMEIVQAQSWDAPPLSIDFAVAVLDLVKQHVTHEAAKWDYPLRTALPDFGCLLPPAVYAEAVAGWPLDRPESRFFADTAARFIAVVEQRSLLVSHPFFSRDPS